MAREQGRGYGAGTEIGKPSEAARWTAAAGYAACLCFFALSRAKRDPFIRFHASQGLLLFIIECAAVAIAVILGLTIGKMKLVWLVAVGLFEIVAALGALTLSVVGFGKALLGEYWSMPFLGEYRDRVPGLHWQEG